MSETRERVNHASKHKIVYSPDTVELARKRLVLAVHVPGDALHVVWESEEGWREGERAYTYTRESSAFLQGRESALSATRRDRERQRDAPAE